MNNFSSSNPNFSVDPKKITRYVMIGIIGLILLILFFMSWTDVAPGEEGFVYRPYGGY